eukprot:CAMPEP_0180038438 /NCGR_PEP_ID=MMETSP0984-20121128/32186_1 /TAXON_ID=483367 /ORGANISM="non described non described, Strain CCMP 2436" /LENGTH=138 /DNA_ID=CAMNT_0021965131 /DNA_START=379 /DNA_END=792 /DNA_ORIENTATION=-
MTPCSRQLSCVGGLWPKLAPSGALNIPRGASNGILRRGADAVAERRAFLGFGQGGKVVEHLFPRLCRVLVVQGDARSLLRVEVAAQIMERLSVVSRRRRTVPRRARMRAPTPWLGGGAGRAARRRGQNATRDDEDGGE